MLIRAGYNIAFKTERSTPMLAALSIHRDRPLANASDGPDKLDMNILVPLNDRLPIKKNVVNQPIAPITF